MIYYEVHTNLVSVAGILILIVMNNELKLLLLCHTHKRAQHSFIKSPNSLESVVNTKQNVWRHFQLLDKEEEVLKSESQVVIWNSWKDNLDNNIIKQYSKTHSSK